MVVDAEREAQLRRAARDAVDDPLKASHVEEDVDV